MVKTSVIRKIIVNPGSLGEHQLVIEPIVNVLNELTLSENLYGSTAYLKSFTPEVAKAVGKALIAAAEEIEADGV